MAAKELYLDLNHESFPSVLLVSLEIIDRMG